MLNEATVMGYLGQDPELRYTQSQEAVATLSVATTKKWTSKGGEAMEHTEWHRVVVWGKTAENCSKYLSKGRLVLVKGELRTRNWEDKDGVKKYTTEIVARDVVFLPDGKGKSDRAPHPGDQPQGQARGNGQQQRSAPPPQQSPQDSGFGGPDAPPSVDEIPF